MKKGLLLLPLLALGLSGCAKTIQEKEASWADVDLVSYRYFEVVVEDLHMTYETQYYQKISYIYTIKTQGISELRVHYISKNFPENTDVYMGYVSYAFRN